MWCLTRATDYIFWLICKSPSGDNVGPGHLRRTNEWNKSEITLPCLAYTSLWQTQRITNRVLSTQETSCLRLLWNNYLKTSYTLYSTKNLKAVTARLNSRLQTTGPGKINPHRKNTANPIWNITWREANGRRDVAPCSQVPQFSIKVIGPFCTASFVFFFFSLTSNETVQICRNHLSKLRETHLCWSHCRLMQRSGPLQRWGREPSTALCQGGAAARHCARAAALCGASCSLPPLPWWMSDQSRRNCHQAYFNSVLPLPEAE